MITPIRTMTIDQICERKGDLLVGSDDVKTLAKSERNKVIDEFTEQLKTFKFHSTERSENCVPVCEIDWLAEQMKGE